MSKSRFIFMQSILLLILSLVCSVCGDSQYKWECAYNADHILLTCQTNQQGTENSVLTCCQKTAGGKIMCESHQPFGQALNQRLGAVELDGSTVYVFGTDGTPPGSVGHKGNPSLGRFKVIGARLDFIELWTGVENLTDSLVYTNVALIPISPACYLPSSDSSEPNPHPIRALLIGVDPKKGAVFREPDVQVYTPCIHKVDQFFDVVPGKYDTWFKDGTTYAVLIGKFCPWPANDLLHFPFISVGGRDNGKKLAVHCYIDSDQQIVSTPLNIEMKSDRQFASVVYNEQTHVLRICGGQYNGELVSSCEEINFTNEKYPSIRHFPNVFGKKSKAGLAYVKYTDYSKHLLNFGYLGPGSPFKYHTKIQTYDNDKFGADSMGTLTSDCVGMVALNVTRYN